MRPLTITILQGAFFPVPPVRGGAVEKLWHALAIEFAHAGHVVTQISRRVPELPVHQNEHGVQHVRVPGYNQPRRTLAIKWCDLLYTWRALRVAPAADILVTNTFWAPLLAPTRCGKIYVSVERMPKGQLWLYRRATALRACSQAVANAIRRELPHRAEIVHTIPNPLPFTPTAPVNFQLKESLILFVGRMHPVKGVTLLAEAFLAARASGALPAAWRLVFIGPADVAAGGGGSAWLAAQRAAYPDPAISWLGPIYDTAELDRFYQRAAVFAYPTLDEAGEAMPIAPLEAMAWGAIPVVSDLACFQDYIQNNLNGFVFNHRSPLAVNLLAEALVRAAAADPHTLGLAAVNVRRTHSLNHIAALFLADFTDLSAVP
jgi:glycosyltransferase involved in cell wall biosynthesis